jgi:beta-lactamase class A
VSLTTRAWMRVSPLVALAFGLSACVPAQDLPPPQQTSRIPAPRPSVLPPVSVDPRYTAAPPPAMAQGVAAIWSRFPDRAGVAIMRADGIWLIAHRGTEFMPQQSVSKIWVAIAVMQAVDQGRLRLDDPVKVTDADLTLFHEPIEQLVGAEGYDTTIGALLTEAMTKSDNTANDVLLRRVGGPSAIRDMLAAKQMAGIRFGSGEPHLQAYTAGIPWKSDYRGKTNFEKARAKLSFDHRKSAMDRYLADPIDGATPIGIARALIRLQRGELLSPQSTRTLLGMMSDSQTGKQRLRAGVPAGWQFLHKTGTGQDLKGRTAGYNDVGLMIAPDGTVYAVVVQIADTVRPIPERQFFMQSVSGAIGNYHLR